MLHHRFSQTIKKQSENLLDFHSAFASLQFCAEERTDFVPHFLLEETKICVVGILDRKQCDVTSRFFQFVVQFLSCPNGTVWSSSPWMIRNGGAAFVTKLTGQHASASSGWRITFLPIRRDSGDAAHCSGSLYGNPRKSVGGYHGQAACTALEYSRFSPTS